MDVTVQTFTFRDAIAQVSERTRAVACAESIAELARRRSKGVTLRAIANCLALVHRVRQRAQRRRVWTGANCLMIGPAVGRRSSQWHPSVAIIIAVAVNSVRAGGRI